MFPCISLRGLSTPWTLDVDVFGTFWLFFGSDGAPGAPCGTLHGWNGLVRRDGFRYNFKPMLNDFNQSHWNELHEKLPGSEKYLGKRIVKSMEDVEESEKDNCITELEDWFLRKTAVDENQDIVNAFFQKRVKTLWNEVLQPILGGKHYIMRYEFQHLGTIHCHMVTSLENGPTLGEMDIARFDLPEYPNVSD